MIAGLVVAGLFTTPYCDLQLGAMPGFFVMHQTAMFIINLMLCVLLFIKGKIERSDDLIRLGIAYLYVALILLPLTASFPGGLMPAPLIGTVQTPLLLWCFWHLGFGLAIARYAWFAGRPASPSASAGLSALVVALLVAGLTYLTAFRPDMMPTTMVKGAFIYGPAALALNGAATLATVGALLGVVRLSITPERLWLIVGLSATCLELWLNYHSSSRYNLGWYVAKVASPLASLTVLISLIHDITLLYSESALNNEALQTLARRDGLTGISNRRHFDELLDEEFRRARRLESSLALVMIDIDFFKGYNDRYGHQAGDECLRRVSTAVKHALLRPGDTAARYGGEEIVVLLPYSDAAGAMTIAERVRGAVAALAIEHLQSPHGVVTVSAGFSAMIPHGHNAAADLLSDADRALYQAKKDGRNQVCAGTSTVFHGLWSSEAVS
jgi:diguanylate cyclase (GGDEF)-like protein